jgi:hypothetical protein
MGAPVALLDEIRQSELYARALVDVVAAQGILSARHPAELVHIAAIVAGVRLSRTRHSPRELANFLRTLAEGVELEVN